MYSVQVFEVLLQYCPEASTVLAGDDSSLPIHVALRNKHSEAQTASYTAAKRLLEVYPGAADQGDSKGFLPIHLLASREAPDTSLLRRLLTIYPLGAETPTSEEAGNLLPIHCAVVAARPLKSVIELLLDAYPGGLSFRCTANLCPLDYLFLNMKSQYTKKKMLRSATPSLRVPSRMEAGTGPARQSKVSPRGWTDVGHGSPLTIIESVSADIIRDLSLLVDSPESPSSDRSFKVDDCETITGRNNNVINYFKGKTDEDILYFTLDLLKSNNFEVTDDIIVMFGSRLKEVSDLVDDLLMFRGNFGDKNFEEDGCQCVVM